MSNLTIKQKVIVIEIDTGRIEVRRMSWKAAREFLKHLCDHLAKAQIDFASLVTPKDASDVPTARSMTPKIEDILLSNLNGIVQRADDLICEIVCGSTNLTPEQFGALDVAQAAAVLQASFELNLGDELKNSFAGIGRTLIALMPATKTNTGDEHTRS